MYAEDIVEACGKIRRFVGGMDYDAFVKDERTRDAVIRNIEIIGEAAKNIPDDVVAKAPEVTAQRARHARRPGPRVLRGVTRDHLGDGDEAHRVAGGGRSQTARVTGRCDA
jgi:hypothetical protein